MISKSEAKRIALLNTNISDAEIEQDIKDTREEIAELDHKISINAMLNDRLSAMKCDTYRRGIEDRQLFIERLEAILDYRKKVGIGDGAD